MLLTYNNSPLRYKKCWLNREKFVSIYGKLKENFTYLHPNFEDACKAQNLIAELDKTGRLAVFDRNDFLFLWELTTLKSNYEPQFLENIESSIRWTEFVISNHVGKSYLELYKSTIHKEIDFDPTNLHLEKGTSADIKRAYVHLSALPNHLRNSNHILLQIPLLVKAYFDNISSGFKKSIHIKHENPGEQYYEDMMWNGYVLINLLKLFEPQNTFDILSQLKKDGLSEALVVNIGLKNSPYKISDVDSCEKPLTELLQKLSNLQVYEFLKDEPLLFKADYSGNLVDLYKRAKKMSNVDSKSKKCPLDLIIEPGFEYPYI